MYLFVYHYETNIVSSNVIEYQIIESFSWRTALIKLFDKVIVDSKVDISMFEKMITAVGDDDAVAMFNALTAYRIDKIYKNLEEFYTEPVVAKEEV